MTKKNSIYHSTTLEMDRSIPERPIFCFRYPSDLTKRIKGATPVRRTFTGLLDFLRGVPHGCEGVGVHSLCAFVCSCSQVHYGGPR